MSYHYYKDNTMSSYGIIIFNINSWSIVSDIPISLTFQPLSFSLALSFSLNNIIYSCY